MCRNSVNISKFPHFWPLAALWSILNDPLTATKAGEKISSKVNLVDSNVDIREVMQSVHLLELKVSVFVTKTHCAVYVICLPHRAPLKTQTFVQGYCFLHDTTWFLHDCILLLSLQLLSLYFIIVYVSPWIRFKKIK